MSLLLPLSLVPLSLLLAPPAHADFDLAVIWPAVTRLNPTSTTYAVTVSDTGPGTLYAQWQGAQQELPHSGEATLDLGVDGVGAVTVVRCDPDCVDTGVASPALEVRRELAVAPTTTWGPVPVGATPTLSFQVVPNPDGAVIHVDWLVRGGPSPSDGIVEIGGVDVTPDASGVIDVPITTPTEMGEGTWGVEVGASATLADFGALAGASDTLPLVVDNPAVPEIEALSPVFYPLVDGYQDSLTYRHRANEAGSAEVTVRDEAGALVRSLGSAVSAAGSWTSGTWDGRSDSGAVVPAGDYVFGVRFTDAAGNATTAETGVQVNRAALKMITSTKIRTAKETLADKFVGSCSTLASPSSHRWAGSLGFYSKTRCAREANNAAMVAGIHAWWIPQAYGNKYGALRISPYGGKARGERTAYLILGYLRASDGAFRNRVQLTAAVGWHNGDNTSAEPFVRYQDGKPFVAWNTGLSEGSRYDVKSFRVVVTYQALVSPSGQVLLPRPTPRTATRPVLSPRVPTRVAGSRALR